jgi:serine protease
MIRVGLWIALGLLYVAAGPPGRVRAQAREDKAASSWASATVLAYADGGKLVEVQRLGPGRVRLAWPDGRSAEAGVGPEAIIRTGSNPTLVRPLPAGSDPALVRLASHDLTLVRPLFASAGLYLVRSTRAGEDGLDLAARLRDVAELEVVPDLAFARRRAAIALPPDDPRYSGQWYLKRLDIEAAWRRTTGAASTVIVIVDDGCDLAHPDLAAHVEPGADLVDGDDDPSFTPGVVGNNHGTACAGIAAAVGDNGEGIAGTCPECHLRCVRLLGGDGTEIPISRDVEAFAQADRWEAAVVSNSWGFVDDIPAPAPLAAAITQLIASGRGGRGAVVVFAAGNESRELSADEITGVPGVIAVGATNNFDEAAQFSNFGSTLDVTAPAGTLTTDVSGAEGGDPGDYTNSFGGTSSSCPVVAGVAALAATLAPEATGEEIAAALIETARPAPFAEPDEHGHDLLYGRGVIDPAAMLQRLSPVAQPEDAGADAGEDEPPAAGDDEGGCSCRVARGARGGWLWTLGVLGLVVRARARARARRQEPTGTGTSGP